MTIRTATLFRNSTAQAVRIPKDLEFTNTKTVEILSMGDGLGLIIRAPRKRKSWLSLLDTPGSPEFEADRTPIADGSRFLADLETAGMLRK